MSSRFSRRRFLELSSNGFGAAALAALMASVADGEPLRPTAERRNGTAHHRPRAKRVIFCFMSGGVSHVDTFDPKPKLNQLDGQPMPVAIQRTQFNNNGNVMASPFQFFESGTSGIPISNLFSNLATVADELAVIRSMTTSVNEHAQANFFMHTGFPFLGHPSAGAWCTYGLGVDSENLPGYVVLRSGSAVSPHGGISLFSNGYLPAQHQGSVIKVDDPEPVRNISPQDSALNQRRQLDFARNFDLEFLARTGHDAQVEAAIRNYETAFRMQTSVPELCDISDEPQHIRNLYGVDDVDPDKAAYATQCLIARRLVERGVRFVELSCLTKGIGAGGAANPWDQHSDLELGHRAMAHQVDQPIAGLIKDLRQTGLLDETIVVWAGEFGRTPFSQGTNGRDHNPFGFSIWLAGGGTKGGTIYGATDELGYHAVEGTCSVYDLWATVLHLLGIDHKRLTFRYSGRDFRLTDVHGHVLAPILG